MTHGSGGSGSGRGCIFASAGQRTCMRIVRHFFLFFLSFVCFPWVGLGFAGCNWEADCGSCACTAELKRLPGLYT